jgi:hypothetical protein
MSNVWLHVSYVVSPAAALLLVTRDLAYQSQIVLCTAAVL